MFTGLLKAYAAEPEKSLVALGRDVHWFIDRSRLEPEKSLPFPLLIFLSFCSLFYRGCFDCIACWDSITPHAYDWLCSHVWPCLTHTYPGVSKTLTLIILFM